MTSPQRKRKAKRDREYTIARAEQLAEFPDCQVQAPGCTGRATEISHIIGVGRGGPKADRENMESACHWCGQYVENHKTWSLETGHHRHGFQKIGE